MRVRLSLAAALVAVVAPGPASADGLPVVSAPRPAGLVSLGGAARYATVAEAGGTVVLKLERDGGHVFASGFLRGRFGVPVVAYDGTVGGLSANGATLVLITPRTTFPRARTRFAVLNAYTLRVESVKTLPGDFSFDAVSPAGDTIFFIEYLSPRDPTDYAVRAYDVEAGRLLPKPIVDPTEPDEQMGGHPLARVSSTDGRWEYTLYDGGAHAPFVHALDTVGREARCIDLDALAGRSDLGDLRLRLTGGDLAVVRAAQPIAVVDLRTFGVREAGEAAARATGGAAWRAALALAVAGAGGAVLLGRRLRRRLPANRAATRS